MLAFALIPVALAGRPDDAVGFADSAAGHIRCHFDNVADADRCADVALWAEEAWETQVSTIGFPAPVSDGPLGGDARLDIYLSRSAGGAGVAWVDCDGGDPDCLDADSHDGRARASAYVVIDPRTDEADFRHYVHHEFNHTLQYGLDYSEPFLCVWEATAVAAERWTDPSWATSPDDFADYQATPWASAVLQDGYFLADDYGLDSWYEYGAVLWMWYLDAHFGDGHGSVAPALWTALGASEAGNEPDVLDAWAELADAPWQDSLIAFTAERLRIGGENTPSYVPFGVDAAPMWRENTLAVGDAVTPVYPPFPLGVSAYDVAVAAGDSVVFTLTGDESTDWALVIDDGVSTVVGGVGETTWTAGESPATVAVINLGPVGLDADDPLQATSFRLSLQANAPLDDPKTRGCATTPLAASWGSAVLSAMILRRRRTRPAPIVSRSPLR